MEDEFGDLYTDVVLPSAPASGVSAGADASGDVLPQLRPAGGGSRSSRPSSDLDEENWLLGPADPAAVAGDDLSSDGEDFRKPPAAAAIVDKGDEDEGLAVSIPGLSSAGRPSLGDGWDSDESDDDLRIVLNDDAAERRRRMAGDEDDEDDDGLVIVANNTQLPIMEEPDWAAEAAAATAAPLDGQAAGLVDGEHNEGADAAAKGALGARTGYAGWNPPPSQHHSMFKYVRPGAATVSGASIGTATGPPGQFRPPVQSGAFAGRGRNIGGRVTANAFKGFHTGYAIPPWGSSARVFGGGDFTLPSHKTIFEVDIDTTFEEKPWKYPGSDTSDFFNFGLDEEKWKEYCKQLEQLRVESTMQSRIRVYESGRSEQEYDPDLPPELAAATGHQDISSDTRTKAENGLADLNGHGRGHAVVRPPLLTGRPIQVETGFGERLPSVDTRQPRMRESDSIIEITLQDSLGDVQVDDAECSKEHLAEKTKDGYDSNEQLHISVKKNESSQTRSDTKRRHINIKEESLSSEMQANFHNIERSQTPSDAKRRQIKEEPLSSDVHANSHDTGKRSQTMSDKKRKQIKEEPLSSEVQANSHNIEKGMRSSRGSSPERHAGSSDEKLDATTSKRCEDRKEDSVEKNDDTVAFVKSEANDSDIGNVVTEDQPNEILASNANIDAEVQDKLGPQNINDTNEESSANSSDQKKLPSSRVEQPAAAATSGQEKTLSSNKSRAKSGSSDHKSVEHSEDVRDGKSGKVNVGRGSHKEMDHNYHLNAERSNSVDIKLTRSKGIDDVHHPQSFKEKENVHGKSLEKLKEPDTRHRRDGTHPSRRAQDEVRYEDNVGTASRKRGNVRSTDKFVKDDEPRGRSRAADGDRRNSRRREMDDSISSRHRNLDENHSKRQKGENLLKRGKVEKEDALHGQRTRVESARKKERDDVKSDKRKESTIRYRERVERRNHRQSKDNTLDHQGRETARSGRTGDDKISAGDVVKKDESRNAEVEKDGREKELNSQAETVRRERSGEQNTVKHGGRGDTYSRDKQLNHDSRSTRQDKSNSLAGTSESHQSHRDRHNDNSRGRKHELSEPDSHRPAKRRRDEHESRDTEKGDTGGENEKNKGSDNAALLKKERKEVAVPEIPVASPTGVDDPNSDDDNQEDSKRGRSKLERWTSHKERDYSALDAAGTFPTSIKTVDDTPNAEEPVKPEAAVVVNSDTQDAESGPKPSKTAEERDRHLETVERLKRRSERFNLPMPGGKEAQQSKAAEEEAQQPQNEAAPAGAVDTEVKPERPARKRRWAAS